MTLLVLVYSLCIKYIAFVQMCFFVSSFSLKVFLLKCLSLSRLKIQISFPQIFLFEEALLFKRTNTRTHSFDILIESFLSLCLSLSSLLSSSVVCSAVLLVVFCRCSFFKRKDALCLLRSLVNDGVGGIQRER